MRSAPSTLNRPQRRLVEIGISRLALLLLLLPWLTVHADPGAPTRAPTLELAIAPYLPSHTLVSNFQPMRAYLETRLQRPVIVVTAPDYRSFHERIRQHAYPLIITVANSAYLAHAESGYVPLLQPAVKTCPVVIVRRTNSVSSILALQNQRIAMPDPLAVISMQAIPLLRQSGLDPGRNIELWHMPTHSAAVNVVLSGEAAAAVVSDRALRQMPRAIQQELRVLATLTKDGFPGVIYMASPTQSRQQMALLTRAILDFTRDTPEGRGMVQQWGYEKLVPASPGDLAPIAPYGKQLREALAATPVTITIPATESQAREQNPPDTR